MKSATADLYVIGFPGGPFKVGWSRECFARLLAFQREHADAALTIVRTVEVSAQWAIEAERYAHWLLREHHLRGEWFNSSADQAIAAIEAAAKHDYRVLGLIPPMEPPGRTPMFPESFIVRFPRQTSERITSLGEARAAFIRNATMAELERRESQSKPKAPAKHKRSTVKG